MANIKEANIFFSFVAHNRSMGIDDPIFSLCV